MSRNKRHQKRSSSPHEQGDGEGMHAQDQPPHEQGDGEGMPAQNQPPIEEPEEQEATEGAVALPIEGTSQEESSEHEQPQDQPPLEQGDGVGMHAQDQPPIEEPEEHEATEGAAALAIEGTSQEENSEHEQPQEVDLLKRMPHLNIRAPIFEPQLEAGDMPGEPIEEIIQATPAIPPSARPRSHIFKVTAPVFIPSSQLGQPGPSRSQGAVRKPPPQQPHKKRSKGRGSYERTQWSGRPQRNTDDNKPEVQVETLKQAIARRKREMAEQERLLFQQERFHTEGTTVVNDPYAIASASNLLRRGRTGICYDPVHQKHQCEWDPRYPESPSRGLAVITRLEETNMKDRCYCIRSNVRADIYFRLCKLHAKEHYYRLNNLSSGSDLDQMEQNCTRYDSVFMNNFTFEVAARAASAALNTVLSVAGQTCQNAMAIVRPPGHHAMENEYSGYCFFNNVAVAAQACLDDQLVSKVLIVDLDVHHGQGTQQFFYGRKDVLYFSIHRYEHGTFWPNLLESNFNYIGTGDGMGYNINVPLNAVGLTDDDYLAIVFSLLLPVAYEYNPDIVIVSAGYDAVIGCPEGRMTVTPGFFAHVITLLSGVAKGQVAVVLEGGYFEPTLAEGACATMKALLGGPCPMLDPVRNVHPSVIETICNVRRMLLNRWNCFKHCETIPLNELTRGPDEHKFVINYFGQKPKPPFPTRRCYPELSSTERKFYELLNDALKEKYKAPMDLPVVYTYDATMLMHKPPEGDLERPERPERLTTIMSVFQEFGLDTRLQRLQVQDHDFEMYNPHESGYLDQFASFVSDITNDIYVNDFTTDAATTAVSCVLTVVDAVMKEEARSGLAIVRPPGHHAEHNKAMGFCFINNIAVAAKYLKDKYSCTRVLIVDFDIHHGNGTQNIFYNTKDVMYISIHRHENGKFFPAGSKRNYTHDGYGLGKGYNINIPFSNDKMGNTEYMSAFHNIILPAAYSYSPEVVLVSAGFDAGINDPLGGYQVSPETFGHFIQMLKPLAEGRVILVLEGGYNLTSTSYSMAICAKVLLGDPVVVPTDVYKSYSNEACKTIRNVTNHLKEHHNIFKINKRLCLLPKISRKVDKFTSDHYNMPLYKELDIERVEYSDYVEQEIRRFNEPPAKRHTY